MEGESLKQQIRQWGQELGFAAVGFAHPDLTDCEAGLNDWLAQGFHGAMDYMAKHGAKRCRPAELVPGTRTVISARMAYWPEPLAESRAVLQQPTQAYLSRYALGRDYHKVLRQRLQRLADRITQAIGPFGHRVFVDSGPVLEVELASRAGLGWRGKHTLLLNRDAGSLFFLGEILIDRELPPDAPGVSHCGRCTACMTACPTGAIVAPYRLDARRCISYLTIELDGPIPEALRPLIGNRIYGCDDCQLVCPWNRFAQRHTEADFSIRHGLNQISLAALFYWSEAEFLERMAGSPIYRIGYRRWLRNLAVGLGNAPSQPEVLRALKFRANEADDMLREHIYWALAQHGAL